MGIAVVPSFLDRCASVDAFDGGRRAGSRMSGDVPARTAGASVRTFGIEQGTLALEAPAITAQFAVRPQRTMARNEHGKPIRAASVGSGTNRARRIDTGCNFGVAYDIARFYA